MANKAADASQMDFTDDQYAAVDIDDKNLIVVAGAGSGKTRVLVERYLRMLEKNPDWSLKSLVAITFTRAAAYEMRQRLRERLVGRARSEQNPVWRKHLSELDSARIDTIHGFCAAILRANAAQAGIDPKFEVLDEVEAAILLENALQDSLATLEPELLALFSHYDSDKILAALKRQELVSLALPEDIPSPEDLLCHWRKQWAQALNEACQRLLGNEAVRQLMQARHYPSDDKLGALYQQYQDCFRQVQAEQDADEIWQLIQECYENGKVGNIGKLAAWGGAQEKKQAAAFLRGVRERLKALIDEIGEPIGELDEQSAQLLPLWLRLMRQVQDAYRQRKLESALVDFDDLESLTARVLKHEPIRQRYRGAEFKHLLVDEFQDTNELQWQIIRALGDLDCGGALFVVGDPKQSIYQFRGADVSVFNRVQGLLKEAEQGQEIALSTSFRSHRRLISLFNALFKKWLVRDGDSPAADFEVAFDKEMSAVRPPPPGASPEDASICPSIEMLLLCNPPQAEPAAEDETETDETEAAADAETEKPQKLSAYDMREWEARAIARRVREIVDSGRLVFDRKIGESSGHRPIRYGDIAMLLQAMSNVRIYEDAFKQAGLPFITIAGRGYYDRQEVWDMLDLLRCLHNPLDNLSLAAALRSPLFGFSDDLLFALRLLEDSNSSTKSSEKAMPLWAALRAAQNSESAHLSVFSDEDRDLLAFALQTLQELRQMAGRVAIFELLGQALKATGYLATLTGLPDGARRRGNIEKLLQLAEDSGKITLGKFSRYLSDLSAREIREGEVSLEAGNALRLMTVHASKGLEFPLVILADTSWTRGGGGADTLLPDAKFGLSCQVFDIERNKNVSGFAHRRNIKLLARKQAAERKRLLYVAATRAQDYLLISGQATIKKGGQLSARGWLGQLLAALGMTELERKAEQYHSFADEQIRVLMPDAPPAESDPLVINEVRAKAVAAEQDSAEFPPLPPPLLEPLPAQKRLSPQHYTATQLADFGAFRQSTGRARDFYRRRLRYHTVEEPAAGAQGRRHFRRARGAVMHELLRGGHYDAGEDFMRAQAWQKGLTAPRQIEKAVSDVKGLLASFHSSDVYQWISDARTDGRPLYMELPFVFRYNYRKNEYVIHGGIDLLWQRADGSWAIVDYKTAAQEVEPARRYHLQLAVYAAAAQARLNLPELPAAFLHYLQYPLNSHTQSIDAADLRAQLSALPARFVELGKLHASPE